MNPKEIRSLLCKNLSIHSSLLLCALPAGLLAATLPLPAKSGAPATLLVNHAWKGKPSGTRVIRNARLGVDAFAEVNAAIAAARSGDRIEVAPGGYHGIIVDKPLDLVATGPGVVIHGASPALTYTSGTNTFTGFTFQTATSDPAILVTGGELILRNCNIIESASTDQAALRVTGGTVDLGTALSPGGNTLHRNSPGRWIDNTSPLQITALGNTWILNGAPVGDPFAIEDGVHHALDAGGGGTVFFEANAVYVTAASGSLQRGLNAINAGGTVNLAAITLVEGPSLAINRNTRVIGQGIGNTLLQPAADTVDAGDQRGWFVAAPCVQFDLSDLTLDGAGRAIHEAIRHHGTGQIQRVRFTQIAAPDNAGVGLRALGQCGEVAVANCAFDQMGRAGAQVSGTGTTLAFSGNTYTGKGPGAWLDYAVQAESGATASLSANTITANLGAAGGFDSAGVIVTATGNDPTRAALTGNSITGNRIAVAAGLNRPDGSLVKLENNTLTANTLAALAVAGGATVDAGDCSAGNVTGLGASAGGNDLTGYTFDNAAPWAIANANTASEPIVLAQLNNFSAGGPGAHIEAVLLDDTDNPGLSAVHASQPALTITCPPALLVECPAEVPASALSLEAFAEQGGAASSTPATVSAADVPPALTADGNIIRTYTVADPACTLTESCAQSITVDDVTLPTITCPADLTVSSDAGTCVAAGVALGNALAADNCGIASLSHNGPAQFPLGLTVVTWTAVDINGNAATCTQSVTVTDNEPPQVNCPADLTVENDPAACTAAVAFAPVLSDNCPGATVVCTPASGAAFPLGTTTVDCVATDAAGNTAQCQFTVTVNDTELPTVTCPADIVVANDADACSTEVTFNATAADNCPGVTVACTPVSGFAFPVGATTVNCAATDAAGNTAACSFSVTVNDTQPPVLTCPGALTAPTGPGLCSAIVKFDAPATDNCPGVAVVCTPPSGAPFPKGNTTVNCIATDAAGLTDACSFVVMVEDTEPPVMICPADITASALPGQCDRAVNFAATATDNCPGVTFVCLPPSGSVFMNGSTTVTCTATDADGLAAACTFTVKVFDPQPPVITYCPPDTAVECGGDISPANTGGPATATDGCDPAPGILYHDAPPLAVTPTALDGWILVVQGFPVTATAQITAGPGTPPLGSGSFRARIGDNGENLAEMRNYTFDQVRLAAITELAYWTYRVTDGAGLNRNIYLMLNIDTDGNGSGDDVIYFEPRFQHGSNPTLPDQGAMVTGTWQRWDAHQGGWWSLNHPEIMAPGINVQSLATYLAAFPQARIVNGLSGGGLRLAAGGGAGVWNGFDGHADYLVFGTNGTSIAYNFDPSAANVCPTVTIRTWTATDLSGNAVSCSQTILLADTTPPALVCAPAQTVACTDDWTFGQPTASDNCGATTISLVGTVTNAGCGITYTATRTWEAVDECGNVSQCSQIITVADLLAPVVSCPADVTIECTESSAPSATGSATATDTCDAGPTVTYVDTVTPGACPQAVVITRTWTATDACGNAGSCDQTLTVVDTTTPTVTCANPKTVECGTAWDFDPPAGVDACGDVMVTVLTTVTNLDCGDSFTAVRSWSVADACGNAVTCMQQVTVQDTTPPLMTCAEAKTVACGESWHFDAPIYSDECVFDSLVYDNSQNDLRLRFSSGTIEVGDEIILDGTARQITRFAFEYFAVGPDHLPTPTDTLSARVRFYANDGPALEGDGPPTPQSLLYDSGDFDLPGTVRSVVTIEDFQVDALVPLVGDVPNAFTWSVQFAGAQPDDSVGLDLYSPVVVGQSYKDYWEQSGTGWQLKTNQLADVNFAARIDAARTNVLVTVAHTVTNAAGACGLTFLATRTWEAVDPCGNLAQCSQTVTVADQTGPILSCPPDVTVECTDDPGLAATGQATATDPCDPAPVITYSDAEGDGDCPQQRVITRTWTATDACGNLSYCHQYIVIDDTTPPVITCPADLTLACDGLFDLDVTGSATATDVCDPAPVITYADSSAPGGCGAGSVITRTWTATDGCGNIATCEQRLTLTDSIPPLIACPAEITVDCDGSLDPGATGAPAVTDNCDPNVAVAFSDTTAPGACPQSRIITRNWTAIDGCGNASACTQIIHVVDATPPVVSCPPDAILDCGASTDPVDTGTAGATDNCAPNPPVTYLDTTATGSCPQEQIITRTWSATDPCGNVGTCTQTITLRDLTPPVIVCPADLTVATGTGACNTRVEFAANATDECGAVTVACVPPSGAPFPKGTTPVTCTATDECGNSTSCTFSVTVEPLSFTQTVNQPIPDANATGISSTIQVTTDINEVSEVEVTLNISHSWNGDLYAYLLHDTGRAVLLNRVGRLDTEILGYGDDGFAVTFSDGAANGDVHVYRLTLFGDHTTPVVGRLTGTWAPDGRATPPAEAVETDPRTDLLSAFHGLDPNGDWTLVVVDLGAGDAGVLESWTLRMCGVVGLPPAITAQPQDTTVECGTDATLTVTTTGTEPLTYQWYFDGNLLPGPNGPVLTLPNVQEANAGIYSVVVLNDRGSVTSTDARLTVVDTQPPQINCPPDLAVSTDPGQCTATLAAFAVTATDACSPVTLVCVPPQGTAFPPGTTTVECTATDEAGLSATCSFTVTAADPQAPVLTCPADHTVAMDPGQCTATAVFNPAVADNCPGASVVCVPPTGSALPAGITTVNCTATDAAGNSATCAFTFTVVDQEAPAVCMDPPATNLAGGIDNFTGPEPAAPSANLLAHLGSLGVLQREFDDPAPDRWLAHTFTGLPANVSSVRLRVNAGATTADALEDRIQLAFSQSNGGLRPEQWTRTFGLHDSTPGLLGAMAWNAGSVVEFSLDLARLPNADGSFTDLLPALRQVGSFDVLVHNDTDLDYLLLEFETCQCSTAIIVDRDPGQCSAVVTYPTPAFFDNCDADPAVVCIPPPGSAFPVGITTVDCTATDTTGNSGSCSFQIQVNDPEFILELQVARTDSNLVLTWPRPCNEYVLEQTASLTPPIAWTPSAVQGTPVGPNLQALLPIDQPEHYFRLRKVQP